jgi:hypothetical protein
MCTLVQYKRIKQCTHKCNSEVRSPNHSYNAKAIGSSHYECNTHAQYYTAICGPSGCTKFFNLIPKTAQYSKQKLLNLRIQCDPKVLVLIFLKSKTDEEDTCLSSFKIRSNGIYRCPRRNVPNFARVFLMLKYTDIIQNTYIQS